MNHKTTIEKQFYRIKDVTACYSISRTSIYRLIKSGKLPKPTRITPYIIGWNKATLDDIFLK